MTLMVQSWKVIAFRVAAFGQACCERGLAQNSKGSDWRGGDIREHAACFFYFQSTSTIRISNLVKKLEFNLSFSDATTHLYKRFVQCYFPTMNIAIFGGNKYRRIHEMRLLHSSYHCLWCHFMNFYLQKWPCSGRTRPFKEMRSRI